jgi:hypothetical protein
LKAKRTVIKQQGAQVMALFLRDEQVQFAPSAGYPNPNWSPVTNTPVRH